MARHGLTVNAEVRLGDALRELLSAAGEFWSKDELHLAAALSEGRVFLDGRRLLEDELDRWIAVGQRLELGERAENTDEQPRVLDQRWGLVAAYKPSGLPTEPDQRSRDSLLSRLEATLGQRLHAMSRLDARVSGVMLLATDSAKQLAHELRARAAIERRYIGVVGALPEPGNGKWSGAIGLGERGKRRVGGRGAKPALTHYRVLATLPPGAPVLSVRRGRELVPLQPAWLEFRLETGRTHQIRVHCAHAGAPLLGDGLYGGVAAVTLPRGNVLELSRIALHARYVGVTHAGSTWQVACPLPQTLEEWWSRVGGEPLGAS
ncbi:MAG: RluA family pseudouridine synthase [Polyangiaceae bacterium]